jgi:hypothetical protein
MLTPSLQDHTDVTPPQPIFVYSTGPIDIWEGWTPLRQLLLRPEQEWTEWVWPQEIAHRWKRAQQIARQIGWEGDIRGGFFSDVGGPWVCPLPLGDYSNEYLIAWKQDNNGQTFIASPVLLPWLE